MARSTWGPRGALDRRYALVSGLALAVVVIIALPAQPLRPRSSDAPAGPPAGVGRMQRDVDTSTPYRHILVKLWKIVNHMTTDDYGIDNNAELYFLVTVATTTTRVPDTGTYTIPPGGEQELWQPVYESERFSGDLSLRIDGYEDDSPMGRDFVGSWTHTWTFEGGYGDIGSIDDTEHVQRAYAPSSASPDWEILYWVEVFSPPRPPNPLSPANGETVYAPTVTITWDFQPGAEGSQAKYAIDIDPDGDFGTADRTYDSGDLEGSVETWTTPVLPEGTYYWRVCTADRNDAWGPWSTPRSFHVDLAPPDPVITSPSPGDEVSGVVDVCVRVNRYKAVSEEGVALSVRPSGGSAWMIVGADTAVDDPLFTIPWDTAAYPDGAYDLSVRAVGHSQADGYANLSAVTTDNPYPGSTLVLLEPEGGTIVGGMVTIRWSGTGYPESPLYSVLLSVDSGQSFPQVLASGLVNTSTLDWDTTQHNPGSGFMIRIEAQNRSNPSDLWGRAQNVYPFTVISGTVNHPPEVEITSPRSGDVVHGNLTLNWTASDPDKEPLTFTLELSDDGGTTYPYTIAIGLTEEACYVPGHPGSYSYTWEVDLLPEGFFIARVKAVDSGSPPLSGSDLSDPFLVRPPSKVPPEVLVLYPNGGETVKGEITIQWLAWAAGIDSEDLVVSVDVSRNAGGHWIPLFSDLPNTGRVVWDSRLGLTPNGASYLLRVRARGPVPGSAEGSDVSNATFTVANIDPPSARIDRPANGLTARAGTSIEFLATVEDPNDDVETVQWEFGDGETGSGASTTHAYARAGSYRVVLVVTDRTGLATRTEVNITILPPVDPPVEGISLTLLSAPTVNADTGRLCLSVRLNSTFAGTVLADIVWTVDGTPAGNRTVSVQPGTGADVVIDMDASGLSSGNHSVAVSASAGGKSALWTGTVFVPALHDGNGTDTGPHRVDTEGRPVWPWIAVGVSLAVVAAAVALFLWRRAAGEEADDDIPEYEEEIPDPGRPAPLIAAGSRAGPGPGRSAAPMRPRYAGTRRGGGGEWQDLSAAASRFQTIDENITALKNEYERLIKENIELHARIGNDAPRRPLRSRRPR